MRLEETTEKIIGAATLVHRQLGPGLLESVYDACFAREMELHGIAFQRQVWLPLTYRGQQLDHALRLDFVVENEVVVELKAVDQIERVHEAQLVSYLRLANKPVGLLINFNSMTLRAGLRRRVHDPSTETPVTP